MKHYQVAVVLTLPAKSYEDALQWAAAIVRDVRLHEANIKSNVGVDVQSDYEHSSHDGRRVLYLHPEDQSFEYNSLVNYIMELEAAEYENDKEFHRLVNRAINLLGLTEKDITAKFGISKPTLERWRNGANAPHPAMRKPIYSYFKEVALDKLTRT